VSTRRLETLFDLHHLRLYRLARRLSRDPEEARDLVQQTFLRAAGRPASIPGPDSGAEAWLVTTLVNLCRDRHRRTRVRDRAAGNIPVPRSASDPESSAVARATVESALARLSPRRRAVIVLHELEDRDPGEISALLGITRVTVRWHLARGREELRKILLDPRHDTKRGNHEEKP
jgi:RNA polymerase sigma-70 factor (ECF subfamily)